MPKHSGFIYLQLPYWIQNCFRWSCMQWYFFQSKALDLLYLTSLYACTDINECTEGTDGCAQTCRNTIGSYTCSCMSGYRLANNSLGCNGQCKSNNKSILIYLDILSYKPCTDINECNENRDGCAQLCSNTAGSYICNCNPGYRLATNGRACNGEHILLNNTLYSMKSMAFTTYYYS